MSGYLLDTHTVLWMAAVPQKLSTKAKEALLDEFSTKYVSIASAWEVALKLSLGKLELADGLNTFYAICQQNGLQLLSIEKAYLQTVIKLPFYHRDPFDRLLIATAINENLPFITADNAIHQYQVNCVW